MVRNAVILAAGIGSRLKDKTKEKPKGFLVIDGYPLIEHSIKKLLDHGIEKIYIGTGYLSRFYEQLASECHQITCIKSQSFETTGSMYTLNNMRDYIDDDFLLLESDLLYQPQALDLLLKDKRPDIILASGKTRSGDEVYLEADEHGNLVTLSKNRDDLRHISGELVGISKLSLKRYNIMCDLFEAQQDLKVDYEYIFVKSTKRDPFPIRKVDDLIWCEIDDAQHLDRAVNEILPQLKIQDLKP